MGLAAIQCWCGLILSLGILASPGTGSEESDQRLQAADVAGNFIKALVADDDQDLLEQITDPFTVEGRVLKGQDQIIKYLRKQLVKATAEIRKSPDARIEVFSYQMAVKKFGKPPKKFSHIKLKSCLFAAVSYQNRRGILIILKKHKKEGWRVTAVTD